MKTQLGLILGLSLVAASCGGGDVAEPTSTTNVTDVSGDTQPKTTQSAPTTTKASDEDPAEPSGEQGTGTATVGDTTWEVALTGGDGREACDPDFSGLFYVWMFDDEFESTVSISGPNIGGNAVVKVGSVLISDELWVADSNVYSEYGTTEGIPDGIGATISVSGNVVSGEGTFYEERAMNETRTSGDPYDAGVLKGTFEAICPTG